MPALVPPTYASAETQLQVNTCRLRRRRRDRRRRGMTIIEVMIVMVIMAMVAVAAGFAVMPVWQRAQVRQARTDAATIRNAVIAYQIEVGGCPTVADLVEQAVLSGSTTTVDPWGQPFSIACDAAEPVVRSAGADGQLETDDDIL